MALSKRTIGRGAGEIYHKIKTKLKSNSIMVVIDLNESQLNFPDSFSVDIVHQIKSKFV